MPILKTKSRVGGRPKGVPQEIPREKDIFEGPLFLVGSPFSHGRTGAWVRLGCGLGRSEGAPKVGPDVERVLFSFGGRADRGGVRFSGIWLIPLRRSSVFTAVLLLVLGAFAGCASAPVVNTLALPRGHAEISVTNLSPHLWQLALRAPQANDAIRVEVKPRETFAVTMPGGDYVVEQTLIAVGRPPASRQFTARFDAGERYRWDLATLLTTEDGSAP